MKKTGLFLVILMIFFAGCQANLSAEEPEKPEKPAVKEMSKELCDEFGGSWNECGSPCAGTDADYCIQVCQAQCECGGIAGFNCPEGFKCRLTGKIADEMGVCIKE